MPLLNWRSCIRSDLAALQAFECTDRPHRPYGAKPWRGHHAKPWEQTVEREIHNLTPSCGPESAVLLGEDDHGLAAVVAVSIDEGRPDVTLIEGIALTLRLRGRRAGHSDEALQTAFQWAITTADNAGRHHVTIIAQTHPKNAAAEELLTRSKSFVVYSRDADAVLWTANDDIEH